jgi:hypothetical protein
MVADRLTQWRKGVEMVEGILGRLHASLLADMGDCNGEETVGTRCESAGQHAFLRGVGLPFFVSTS